MNFPSAFHVVKRLFPEEGDRLVLAPEYVELPDALLGSGTPDATTFLRGDRTWAVPVAAVPDPLEVDDLVVNVLAEIEDLDLLGAFRILEPGGPDGITLAAPALAASYTLTLPEDDGDAGQVLTTDGAGNLTWETPAAGGNEFQSIILEDDDESAAVTIQAPGVLGASYTLTLPEDDGDADEVLATDGAGGLSWVARAPTDASYIVVALSSALSAERRLQAEASVLALTDGGANGDLTVSVAANGITDAKLRQGGACTVIGRSANSSGNVADIAAASNGQVLARVSDALAFTAIAGITTTPWRYRQIGSYYTATFEGGVGGAQARDIISAIPFLVPVRTQFDRIAFRKINNGTANSEGWVAVYANTSDSEFYPDELIVQGSVHALDSSEINGAGLFSDTIDETLEPGLYWLVFLGGTAAIAGINGVPATAMRGIFSFPEALGASPDYFDRYLGAFTYQDAAPDPFPDSIAAATGQAASPFLRVASYP